MSQANRIALAALLALAGYPVDAQILQDRPELCSSPNPVPLPLGTNSVSTGSGADLTFRLLDGSSKTLQLMGPDEIREICPLGDNRLAAFGVIRGGDGYIIWLLSETNGAVLDTIGARDPKISPDGRWLIYRERYPTRSEAAFEQYLLYDIGRDPAANRLADRQHRYPPGRLVYPVTVNRTRLEEFKVAPDQYHTFVGQSFFWSQDSKSVVFADRVGKITSIVVVRIQGDEPKAFIHNLTISEMCAGKGLSEDLVSSVALSEAYVAEGGLGDILVRFSPQRWMDTEAFACRNSLPLSYSTLKPAELEEHQPEGGVHE